MPVFPHDYVTHVAFSIIKAMGASDGEARTVATHLVRANLAGHDSHGIVQVPMYVERIRGGDIVPGAAFEVTSETSSTASVDGHWGFGAVITEQAMDLAIDKAKSNNVSVVTVVRQGHVGRLADYAVRASENGMIAFIMCDSGRKSMSPFGGAARRMGTNPICISVPTSLQGPLVLDMATATVAAGKLRIAARREEAIPPTWLIDKEGNPTTDPSDFWNGGALVPVGADQGQKGSGLAFMVEVMAGILTGVGFGDNPDWIHNDGCFIMLINVAAFRPLEEFKRETMRFADFITATPPAKGFDEVLYPGELGWKTAQKRSSEGIFVEDETWQALRTLIDELGVTDVVGPAD